jgi:hypothetical protein
MNEYHTIANDLVAGHAFNVTISHSLAEGAFDLEGIRGMNLRSEPDTTGIFL